MVVYEVGHGAIKVRISGRFLLFASIAGLILLTVILADYFELFGIVSADGISSRSFIFKILDNKKNQVVTGVEIEVRRLEEHNLSFPQNCRYHVNTTDETVSGVISIWTSWRRTMLFEKQRLPAVIDIINFQFEFRHPSYKTQRKVFQAKDLDQLQVIKLEPLE